MKVILTIELEQPTTERLNEIMDALRDACRRTLRRTDSPMLSIETDDLDLGGAMPPDELRKNAVRPPWCVGQGCGGDHERMVDHAKWAWDRSGPEA